MQNSHTHQNRGFTLVELLVSLALFSIVVVSALGAVLTISDANRRVQKNRAVMDNINLAMESMSRNIRLGRNYYCTNATPTLPIYGAAITTAQSCSTGGTYLAFEDQYGSPSNNNDQDVYYFDSVQKKIMYYAYDSGGVAVPLTSNELEINSLKFYVTGTTAGQQPKVTIVLSGVTAVGKGMRPVEINLQTTISQRELNI
jgi:prepilin-type N-terminal cleavage/methylation domain-containing protein